MYIDIHTHNRVQEEDVKKIINIQVTNYINCCGFDLRHLFSLGIHPWKINPQLLSQDLKFLDENARYDSIKAIGECGLDKLTATDWDLQMKTFRSQVVISEQVGKPMILHCVKAFDELIAIKREFEPRQAWIIHGFRGKPQQMEQLIRQGFYLSFGEQSNPETVRETPIDKFFLETDDAQISIKEVYAQVSGICGMEEDELLKQMEKNFEEIV